MSAEIIGEEVEVEQVADSGAATRRLLKLVFVGVDSVIVLRVLAVGFIDPLWVVAIK